MVVGYDHEWLSVSPLALPSWVSHTHRCTRSYITQHATSHCTSSHITLHQSHCTSLHHTTLHHITLHMPHCITSHYTCHTASHHTTHATLHHITLHMPHCITSHYTCHTIPHHTTHATLHHITLHMPHCTVHVLLCTLGGDISFLLSSLCLVILCMSCKLQDKLLFEPYAMKKTVVYMVVVPPSFNSGANFTPIKKYFRDLSIIYKVCVYVHMQRTLTL